MVAWHMRIFCCKTFFGQNSHINFIELYHLQKYRCNKNTKKRNIFKFNSKCLEKGVFLKKKTLHTYRRIVEEIGDIFQSHFNAVKNTSIFSWTISCWGTSNIVFTEQQLSYNFGKNSDLCKCSGGLELLDSPEFCFQKIDIPHWR